MALIAYLMEHKNNYGPHLIIVPNAVIVNWKSELQIWLPDVKCIYYTGTKEVRAQLFKEFVQPVQFNCLVTTYELVMRDASKLKGIEWKYCVIDEAQRMKNRESKLARDLDKCAALALLGFFGRFCVAFLGWLFRYVLHPMCPVVMCCVIGETQRMKDCESKLARD